MKLSALLTSAGINIGVCTILLSLYSVLRKQPGFFDVYFGRRIAEERARDSNSFILERFVPSASWILKALETKEDEILAVAGLDAVAFLRLIVFSIRIFSIAAVVCMFGVIPLNYYGQEMSHSQIPSESLDVFTIGNIKQKSKWLWVHCVVLYIISCSACVLLYYEYRRLTKMRLAHISRSHPNPSHFTVLVRAIPRSNEHSFNDSVRSFFATYHSSSYLSHQMICRTGKVQKILSTAEKVYGKVVHLKATVGDQRCIYRCGLCGTSSFQLYHNESDLSVKKTDIDIPDPRKKEKECSAAFVFFKTRYAASVVSQVMQSSNPMLWITDLAPEPRDVYWSNLWLPYRQLWLRRIATLLAAIAFMVVFLIPVTFVQGLSQLDQLQQRLPFLKGILKKAFVSQLVTGYLPSVVLSLFLCIVPPIMMLFSSVEGPISRSARKKSACSKVLYFNIWNVFFVTVLSGSVIHQVNFLSSPKDIPTNLAKAVPMQATFFITYVLTSGWASLSSELMQLFGLIWNLISKGIMKTEANEDSVPSFPYHTEIPRVLLFGLLGFTCAILAPLILPFLLVYFLLGFVVYRNQILNVYCVKYETGGQMWPIIHNTTVFSLVLAQIIALGVFSLKEQPVAAGFTIPLILCTLLFNEYCRLRFHPVFKRFAAQDIIEMDRVDVQSGRLEEIHRHLPMTYSQFTSHIPDISEGEDIHNPFEGESSSSGGTEIKLGSKDSEIQLTHPTLTRIPVAKLQEPVSSLSRLLTFEKRTLSM